MPVEVMKNIRLVSKAWRDATEPIWFKATQTLTLLPWVETDEASSENSFGRGDSCQSLEQLQNLCESNVTSNFRVEKYVRYRKFIFKNWIFDKLLIQILNDVNDAPSDVGQWFWRTIAPTLITNLTICECELPDQLIILKEPFLRALPRLQRLIVSEIYCSILIPMQEYQEFQNLTGVTGLRQRLELQQRLDVQQQNGFQHYNLISVNIRLSTARLATAFASFCILTPALQELELSGSFKNFALTMYHSLPRLKSLRKLVLLDFSGKADATCVTTWPNMRFYNLENVKELQVDIGYEDESTRLLMTGLQDRALSLEKLTLYRAPFSPVPKNILECKLKTLTELYLWGNMFSSFNFLTGLPNLRLLVWITSCCDKNYNGRWLTNLLDSNSLTYPVFGNDLVKTTRLDLKMEQMKKLELDFGPLTESSLNRLKDWMPNLESLKVMVNNPLQLHLITENWPELIELELAHGTKVNGSFLLKTVTKFKALKMFVWKRCNCTDVLLQNEDFGDLRDFEKSLKLQVDRIRFPWSLGSGDIKNCDSQSVCKLAELDGRMLKHANL